MEVLFPADCAFEIVQASERKEEDQKVVQEAANKLQEQIPGATLELLYVKEIEATE